jgi:Domain of unknown function (DUF6089)
MNCKKLLAIGAFLGIFVNNSYGQQRAIEYTGEYGFSAGGAEYFGDLNPNYNFRAIEPAIGIFYRRFFNPYIGVRADFHFIQVGYSDAYSNNAFQKARNLSFNSNVWEFTLQGDFNFFKFIPGTSHRFTPYITFGAGIFLFNPYAYYQGNKYYLEPLGTEGQGSFAYPNRKFYALQALCIPVGAGVKYNVNKKINVGFEVVQRFTSTDYLDDVSTTYAGAAVFPTLPNGQSSIAYILQDRSNWNGQTPIGTMGRQRGDSKNKDQYLTFELNISFLISAYRCPTL